MASFPHDCPHCGTKQVAFEVRYENNQLDNPDQFVHSYAECGVCSRPVVIIFRRTGETNIQHRDVRVHEHLNKSPGDFQITAFYPTPDIPDAPEHLPENVEQFFNEAIDNLKTGPNAAGAMLRKSVDVGLKIIAPKVKGTFFQRIDKLAEDGKITTDLAKWAHKVRLEGNDASHEVDPFKPEEAEKLYRFTDLLLRYLFTLPGMLEEYQAVNGEDEVVEVTAEDTA
tara:strand:+ start:1137 stop:1814 length:678 start_codon:yes stop_codon:yes gene_type:complete